ncbi:MAG: methyltransferase [Mariniphaga sp.]
MGGNNWFQFKQFRIEQRRAAMKVGTDGVLLGAWTPIEDSHTILDVGTGTGLVALMLAQRSKSVIDALEIDQLASDEARFNFKQSVWYDRLHCIQGDFNIFAKDSTTSYDLIVSNPPFFVNSLKTKDPSLSIARHSETLTFEQLITGAKLRLVPSGCLCVIIPLQSCPEFKETSRISGFYLRKQTTVIPKIGKPAKRALLAFSLQKCYPIVDELIILDSNGLYTDQFKSLTASFYPAF